MKNYKLWIAIPKGTKKGYKWEYSGKLNKDEAELMKQYKIKDDEMVYGSLTFGVRLLNIESNIIEHEYINMEWLKNHKKTIN